MKESFDDMLSSCIRCGFCLESCPTYQETGVETESPRGRIYLLRSAEAGIISFDSIQPHVDRCLGCRACEPACPSGVKYGHILEQGRARLKTSLWTRLVLFVATHPWATRLAIFVGRLQPGQPPSKIPRLAAGPVVGEVLLLQGCGARAMFPGVHEAAIQVLGALGFRVQPVDLGCCGALHAHNGQLEVGQALAEGVRTRAAGKPVIVTSAGCGSHLRDGSVPQSDIMSFLLEHGVLDLLKGSQLKAKVTYHDACHHCHAQGIRSEPRRLLQAIPGLELVEMDSPDRCCGSAGIYSALQTDMASRLRNKKLEAIEKTGVSLVVLANPGCHSWIADGLRLKKSAVRVVHIVELIALALAERP